MALAERHTDAFLKNTRNWVNKNNNKKVLYKATRSENELAVNDGDDGDDDNDDEDAATEI